MIKERGRRRYPVLVKDVDDDNKLPIVLAVVDESHPSDLNVPLERLPKTKTKNRMRSKKNKTKSY